MNFTELVKERCRKKNSLLCIGLDVVLERIPVHLQTTTNPLYEFNKAIIAATSDYAVAYKLNTAFYEAHGIAGYQALQASIADMPEDIIAIIDAKRGDIENTAKMYAKALFEELRADAITASPLLGRDAATPFLTDPKRGVFFLCLTSNPGSADFQRFSDGTKMLFEHIAQTITSWNEHGNCGLVVGATHAEDMRRVRHLAVNLPFLIPGIGAQGGDLEKSVLYGTDNQGELALFNSSRNIIFKSSGKDFADVARHEAKSLRDLLNTVRRQKL